MAPLHVQVMKTSFNRMASTESTNGIKAMIWDIFLPRNVHFILNSFTLFGLCSTLTVKPAEEYTEIFRKLMKDYNKDIPPVKNGEPVNVTVQIFINDMVPYEQMFMHYSADFFLRLVWNDYRLENKTHMNQTLIPLSTETIHHLWTPDIFFPFAKKGVVHALPETNSGAQLYLNGTVVYSKRTSVVSFCPMILKYYPFDIQRCTFAIMSYTYSNNFLQLHWSPEGGVAQLGDGDDLNMLEFNHVFYTTKRLVSSFGKLGDHDRLEIKFRFHRYFPFFFLRDFFPCLLIVILSWISFWIDYTSTPARVGLGITTVLTVVTMTNSVRANSPPAGIFRSLDWYLLICNLYVFAALAEYALVGLTYYKKNGKKRVEDTKVIEMKSLNTSDSSELNGLTQERSIMANTKDNQDHSPKKEPRRRQVRALHRIDNICKFAFPLTFCLFNGIYFLFHRLSDQTVD